MSWGLIKRPTLTSLHANLLFVTTLQNVSAALTGRVAEPP